MEWSNGALEALVCRAEEYVRLKDITRTGWALRGIHKPESVADHSWGTALLCLLFAPAAEDEGLTLKRDRMLAIALVHDLAEVEVGDIPRRADPGAEIPSPEEKARRETAAMGRLTTVPGHESLPEADQGCREELPGASLGAVRKLWEEYESGVSPEARFVRDMNLIDMGLQAVVYETERRYDPAERVEAFPEYQHLDEFFETSRDRLSTPIGKNLHQILLMRYQRARDRRYN